MGSAPSRNGSATTKTSVQKICIDQSNGEVQSRGIPIGARRASLALVSTVTDKIRKSASSISSKSGLDKEKRVRNLQIQLDSSNKKRAESEMFVRVLQNELAVFDLRNKELVEEMDWLKQKLGSGSAMLNSLNTRQPSHPPNGWSEEVERLKTKSKVDRDIYENLVNKLQQELRDQEDRWNQRRINLESQLGDARSVDSTQRLGNSQPAEETNSYQQIVGHSPTTFEQEQQEQQSSCALSLESSYSSVDLQPMCRNLLPKGGRMATPQNESDQPPHHSSIRKRAYSAIDIKRAQSAVSAHPSRRASSLQQKENELTVDKLLGEDDDRDVATPEHNLSVSHDSGIFTIPPKSIGHTQKTSNKLKSAAWRRTRPTMGCKQHNEIKQLGNVFTLSDEIETLKVVDSPDASTTSSTTGQAKTTNESPVTVKNIHLDGMVEGRNKVDGTRRVSAPTSAMKPRDMSRTRTVKQNSEHLPDDSDFTVEYLDDTDEEVNDILYSSLPSHSLVQKIKSAKKMGENEEKDTRASTSAKSRDSGYLEEQNMSK